MPNLHSQNWKPEFLHEMLETYTHILTHTNKTYRSILATSDVGEAMLRK